MSKLRWGKLDPKHHDHIHIAMSEYGYSRRMTTVERELSEPEWTYDKLEKELYHKGHGQEMDKRKVGNNTWLMRGAGSTITVRLHNTDILEYHPDGRVVLNASNWTTQTTKDRMNAFLGWNTIEMSRGYFYAHIYFRRYDTLQQRTNWYPARVEFRNHMTLDVRTHELVSHPDETFTKIDDSIVLREAADLSRVLGKETKHLIERLREGEVTKDDLRHALMMVNRYREERERLSSQIHRLESAMDWASATLEDAIEAAVKTHADLQHERRAKLQKLFDPEEVEAMLDEIYRMVDQR